MSSSTALYAAADIGGTKIYGGLVRADGTEVAGQAFSTPLGDGSGEKAVQTLLQVWQHLACEQGIAWERVQGFGLAVAGPVDIQRQTVENPYTLPGWEHFPLGVRLQQEGKRPAVLDNDANGALLGEIALRKWQNKRVLMLTFGTGIGAAFYDGNGLYRAEGAYHPEMGHILVASGEGEEPCYCGQKGCFENLCSGTALNRRARRYGFSDFDEAAGLTKENPQAAAFLQTVEQEMSAGLWSLCTVFRPQIVLGGGGVMARHFPVLQRAANRIPQNRDFTGPVQVQPASPGGKAPLIGAAMFIHRKLSGKDGDSL